MFHSVRFSAVISPGVAKCVSPESKIQRTEPAFTSSAPSELMKADRKAYREVGLSRISILHRQARTAWSRIAN